MRIMPPVPSPGNGLGTGGTGRGGWALRRGLPRNALRRFARTSSREATRIRYYHK